MTKAQAEKLLIIALKYQKYDLSLDGVFVDGDLQDKHGNPPHPGYYDFSLGYDTPTAGAIDYWGLFSVSSQTGDIWEINKCERIIFPQLQKIQQEIMKKLARHLPVKWYSAGGWAVQMNSGIVGSTGHTLPARARLVLAAEQ